METLYNSAAAVCPELALLWNSYFLQSGDLPWLAGILFQAFDPMFDSLPLSPCQLVQGAAVVRQCPASPCAGWGGITQCCVPLVEGFYVKIKVSPSVKLLMCWIAFHVLAFGRHKDLSPCTISASGLGRMSCYFWLLLVAGRSQQKAPDKPRHWYK